MLHLTQIPSLGQGGLVTGIATLLVLFAGVPTRPPRWLLAALAACVGLALLIQALLSIWYLSSPTYIDHIEASAASTTHYFMQGKPIYPPLAKQARISGVVHLNAVISKDGTIQDLKVISGHPLLVPSALEAVKQWVYQPTLLNGEPVEVVTQIDVNFTLSQ